jgi:hypothetical protein
LEENNPKGELSKKREIATHFMMLIIDILNNTAHVYGCPYNMKDLIRVTNRGKRTIAHFWRESTDSDEQAKVKAEQIGSFITEAFEELKRASDNIWGGDIDISESASTSFENAKACLFYLKDKYILSILANKKINSDRISKDEPKEPFYYIYMIEPIGIKPSNSNEPPRIILIGQGNVSAVADWHVGTVHKKEIFKQIREESRDFIEASEKGKRNGTGALTVRESNGRGAIPNSELILQSIRLSNLTQSELDLEQIKPIIEGASILDMLGQQRVLKNKSNTISGLDKFIKLTQEAIEEGEARINNMSQIKIIELAGWPEYAKKLRSLNFHPSGGEKS